MPTWEVCLGCGSDVPEGAMGQHRRKCIAYKSKVRQENKVAMSPEIVAQADRERQGRNLMRRVARQDAKAATT